MPQSLDHMQLTSANGDTYGDGDLDQIMAFGARSFSLWNSDGARVYVALL